MNQSELNTSSENLIEQQDKDRINTHIDTSINQIRNLMKKYVNSNSNIDKADKLAYWLEDYARMLDFEDKFDPTYFKSYKRGDIIKVNLGYNIGNEEGGLHYCVVIDKNNAITSGIITVVPLTSYKGKDLHYSSVFLGNEIYKNFKDKYDALLLKLSRKVNAINVNTSQEEIKSALDDLAFIQMMDKEMSKMKKGSVALISQITTISKQKIYNPQKYTDILSGLRLSNDSLDLINNKIKELFVKN